MARSDLYRRVAKVVSATPPLTGMSDLQRREFHEALTRRGRVEDLPGKWHPGDLAISIRHPLGSASMTVIEVITKNVASEHKGAAKPKLGDQDFFTDDLLDPQDKGLVGTHSGFCTLVRITPATEPDFQECQATFTLPQGQVTARGLFSLPMAVGQSSKVAITGGTGAYANARGQVTWTQLADGGRITLDIVL